MASDKRTAKAREFIEDYALPLRIRDGQHKAQILTFAAAFAESELSSAIKEAREECARAVCETCANGDEPVKTDVGWCHAGVMPGEYVFCSAQEIRALGER